jgi:hypothetical protein
VTHLVTSDKTPSDTTTTETAPETTYLLPKPLIERPAAEVPIKEDDFNDFRTWFCETPQDTELFNKIFSNLRMLDEQEFDVGIRRMEAAIAEFVGEDPYYLLVDAKGKGGDLMMDKLNLQATPPTGVLRIFEEEKWPNPNEITENAKFVFVDDTTLSGAYLRSMRDDASKHYEITSENSMFTTVASTAGARQFLQEQGFNNFYSTYNIPVSSEVLTEEEMQQLYSRYERVGEHWFLDHRVLTFMYYKVPDNFMAGFMESQPVAVYTPAMRALPAGSVEPEYHFFLRNSPGGIYPYYKLPDEEG